MVMRRNDRPAVLLDDLQRLHARRDEDLHAVLLLDVAEHRGERLEQLVEVLHRHEAADDRHRFGALRRDHHAGRTGDVEAGEALELRRHHERRLDEGVEAGLIDESPHPADLLLQIGVGVAGDDGEHDRLVGGADRRS